MQSAPSPTPHPHPLACQRLWELGLPGCGDPGLGMGAPMDMWNEAVVPECTQERGT